MPANRVTSETPWHVVLVLDDSGSMEGKPAADVNDGLKSMLAEMEVVAKGTKPYFKVSIVSFGSGAQIIEEFKGEREIDANAIAVFSGSSGTTAADRGLQAAIDILKRNPGKPSDFRPYVFFFSDGQPDDAGAALNVANNLKALDIAAGNPTVIALGLGNVNDQFMKSVATNAEFYIHLTDSSQLARLFPLIGTVAGSRASGEDAINKTIINI